jgi:uncharacterized protein YjcR
MRGGSELMKSVISVDKHVFSTMIEMAEYLGVEPVTLYQYKYRHPKMSIENIYWHYKNRREAKYVLEGKEFTTLKEVAKFLNVSYSSMRSFLQRHDNSIEDAYEFFKHRDLYGFQYKSYIIDDMEFFSHKDIADYLGITVKQFQNFMYGNGLTLEKAYYHFKNKRLQEEKHESKEYQH